MKMAHEGFVRVSYSLSLFFHISFRLCPNPENDLPKRDVVLPFYPDSRNTDASSFSATKKVQVHAKTTPRTTNSAVVGDYNIARTADLSFETYGFCIGFWWLIVSEKDEESVYLNNRTYMFYKAGQNQSTRESFVSFEMEVYLTRGPLDWAILVPWILHYQSPLDLFINGRITRKNLPIWINERPRRRGGIPGKGNPAIERRPRELHHALGFRRGDSVLLSGFRSRCKGGLSCSSYSPVLVPL